MAQIIYAMEEVVNKPGEDGVAGKYNDAAGVTKFVKKLEDIAVGEEKVIMIPNQVKGVVYALDVETGSGTATVQVTGSDREDVENETNVQWEDSPAGSTAVNVQGTTKTITAIRAIVTVTTAKLTVHDNLQRNN